MADMQNLDKDVEWFKDKVSTTENVAIFCWQRLRGMLPSPGESPRQFGCRCGSILILTRSLVCGPSLDDRPPVRSAPPRDGEQCRHL